MFPILFKVGSFEVRSFGLLMLLSFVAAAFFASRRAPRYGLKGQDIYDVSFWALIGGVLGARIVYIALNWKQFAGRPDQLWTLRFDGLTSFGGLFFGMLAAILWSKVNKKSVISMLDTISAPFLVGHIIGRVGCLLNGCCYGGVVAASFPFGVSTPDDHEHHVPAQAYDSLMNIAVLGILLAMERKGLRPGQSISAMLFLHAMTRFIYEFWRAGWSARYLPGMPITEAQLMTSIMMVVGLGLFIYFGKRGSRTTSEIQAA